MTIFPTTYVVLVLAMIVVAVLSIFLGSSSASLAQVQGATENICSKIDCMQGTCKVDDKAPILGFECECFPGWTKFQFGPLTFPVCNVPNCTLNLNCGSTIPSSPSSPTLPINLFDPCTIAWCGDGNCTAGEGSHVCHCNPGSSNFGGVNSFPCFQNCSLGGDCEGIKINQPATPTSDSKPPLPSNGSSKVVSNEPAAAMMILLASATILLISCMYGTSK